MSQQTWGDIIARNYSAGRAIADDFVSSRYAKKADELRTTYEERAKSEGKQLQDYLPDLEAELRQLAAGVGATRRGVTDASGKALDMGTMGRIREDVGRMGDTRAGALALAGDQAGARQTRAGAQYAIGEFDAGQGQQVAGDTIAATSSAIDPKTGAYDAQKGALGVAKVGAQYGNADVAAGQTEAADTFRMKSAAAKATQLYNIISNPESADADQVTGLWEGIKQDIPEYKNVDLRLEDGKIYIYENGKATGDLDPQEAAQLLQTAIQAPGQAIQSSMQAQLKAVEDSKTRTADVDKQILQATIDVVRKLEAAGIDSTVSAATVAAQKAVAQSGSMKLVEIGADPNTYMIEAGGDKYVVKTNTQPNLETGEPGGTVQVFDLNGNPVPAEVLNKIDVQSSAKALTDLSVARAAAGTQLNVEVMNQQMRILNDLGAAYGGSQRPLQGASSGGGSSGGNSRAERNNNPGNIEDIGQFKNFPGYKGTDGRFAIFDSPEAGQKAFENQLQRYMEGKTTGQPLTSVSEIIGTWSPQADPTNQKGSTNNYAAYVAKKLGVDPTQPLTPAQIPQLAAAMAEFESGNTGGAPAKKGALPTAAEQRGEYAAAPSAAAAGAVAVAKSAPAQQTRVPGKKQAISPEFVRKQSTDLLRLRDEYNQATDALAQFDEDRGTERGFTPGRSLDSPGKTGAIGLTPAQAKVRQRLLARVDDVGRSLLDTRRETAANTAALRRETAGRGRRRRRQLVCQ